MSPNDMSPDAISRAAARREAVGATVAHVKATLAKAPLDRAALAAALADVRALAARRELWSPDDYPPPDEQTRQARYLIQEDPDKTYALYLNVMLPGRHIAPHNHTTWACIAGVDGEEHNHVYRRVDDGAVPGHAELVESDLVVVGPERGIALLPDDIHSVEIRGAGAIRHLHMYGRALETLTERVTFDLAAKTVKPMSIGVTTRR
jgi:predicted metal-dependent enzyme (double-stranded beta helix superfamily)